jgi:hypothetical protein
MKQLKNLFQIAISIMTFSATYTYGDIINKIDFENGKVGPASINEDLSISGNAPEIVTSQNGVTPKDGKYMMKTYLNRETSATNYRSEVAVKSPAAFEKGKEYWVGISVFLPKDWNLNYGSNVSNGIVWQFHGRPYNSPDGSWRKIQPIVLWHTANGWLVNNLTYSTSSPNKEIGLGNLAQFSGKSPYKLGQWNDFVVNVKFSGAQSPNDTNGFVKVWINGNKVVDQSGQNYFGEEPQGPFFKFGLYNSTWKYRDQWVGPSSRLLYHDGFRVGNSVSSYSEVLPSGATTVLAPPSPPSSVLAQ